MEPCDILLHKYNRMALESVRLALLAFRQGAQRAFHLLRGCYHDRSIRKDARSARDHADRNLAEELSRRRKADGPTARAGSACDGAGSVLAHDPRLGRAPRGGV